MKEPTRLSPGDRLLLCVSVIALGAAIGMLQCAALSVGADLRSLLTTSAALLVALAVSVLIEDAIVKPLHTLLRRLPRVWSVRSPA